MPKSLLPILLCVLLPGLAAAEEKGRLLATGGATSIDGAAGGGIVPWAVLSGYGEEGEWGATAFATRVETGDYRLDVGGVAASYGNRVELSYARQRFDLGTLARDLNLPDNSLSQDIFGLKVRLFGDLIYDRLPQVSLGIEHKRQKDFLVPSLVGAQRDEDTEGYLAASRLFLGGAFGYNLLLNGNLRYSRANEQGLLGFGGDRRDKHSVLKEGSVAVLFNPRWALGVEYREKPDNLSFAGENDWSDVFIGYFPNKHLAVVLAYARLGEIAGLDNQDGAYLSLQEFLSMRYLFIFLTLVLSACATQPPKDDSLYRGLGERAGITRIVEGMLLNAARNPRISERFQEIDIERLRDKLVEQVCVEAGGPCEYTGDSMEESHKGMHLTRSDFNALVEDLIDAMDAEHISVPMQNRLLARLAPMRAQVIER